MKTIYSPILLSLLLLIPASLGAREPRTIPAAVPGQRVYDEASLLSQKQRDTLEKKISALEKEKGSQIAILIVDSTAPEEIEAYTIRVFDQWKIGRKKIDDGVLLTVAVKDRKMRIDVGYGLEGALPDAICKRITSEIIKPEFRKGDYYEGIRKGLDAILLIIHGEKLPEPKKEAGGLSIDSVLLTGFLSIFLLAGFAISWATRRKVFYILIVLAPILFAVSYFLIHIYAVALLISAGATFVISTGSAIASGPSRSGGGSSGFSSDSSSSSFESFSSSGSDSSFDSDFGGGSSGGGGSSDSW